MTLTAPQLATIPPVAVRPSLARAAGRPGLPRRARTDPTGDRRHRHSRLDAVDDDVLLDGIQALLAGTPDGRRSEFARMARTAGLL